MTKNEFMGNSDRFTLGSYIFDFKKITKSKEHIVYSMLGNDYNIMVTFIWREDKSAVVEAVITNTRVDEYKTSEYHAIIESNFSAHTVLSAVMELVKNYNMYKLNCDNTTGVCSYKIDDNHFINFERENHNFLYIYTANFDLDDGTKVNIGINYINFQAEILITENSKFIAKYTIPNSFVEFAIVNICFSYEQRMQNIQISKNDTTISKGYYSIQIPNSSYGHKSDSNDTIKMKRKKEGNVLQYNDIDRIVITPDNQTYVFRFIYANSEYIEYLLSDGTYKVTVKIFTDPKVLSELYVYAADNVHVWHYKTTNTDINEVFLECIRQFERIPYNR